MTLSRSAKRISFRTHRGVRRRAATASGVPNEDRSMSSAKLMFFSCLFISCSRWLRPSSYRF